MKKALSALLAIGMVLSLTACGASENGPASVDEPAVSESVSKASVSESVETSVSEDPGPASEALEATEESVIEDFKAAQNLWFKIEGALSIDSSDVKTADMRGFEADYYRVNESGMSTYDELIDTLSYYVNEDFAKETIDNSEMYLISDGNLYMCPAGRGDDMTMAWVEFSSSINGDKGSLVVTVYRQDYFNLLDDWYETGARDQYEYTFTVVSGRAVFDKMDYLCGPAPETSPVPGHDGETLEAKLISLIAGTWTYVDGTSSYVINEDGSFVGYINGEENTQGQIFSSRADDGSYMMSGDGFSNTIFKLESGSDGSPIITFDEGGTVFVKEN